MPPNAEPFRLLPSTRRVNDASAVPDVRTALSVVVLGGIDTQLVCQVAANEPESVAIALALLTHDLPEPVGKPLFEALARRAETSYAAGVVWTPLHDALWAVSGGRFVDPERRAWDPFPYTWPKNVPVLSDMLIALRPWIESDLSGGKAVRRLLKFHCPYIHFLAASLVVNPTVHFVQAVVHLAPDQAIILARRELPRDTALFLARWANRRRLADVEHAHSSDVRDMAQWVWDTMCNVHPCATSAVVRRVR